MRIIKRYKVVNLFVHFVPYNTDQFIAASDMVWLFPNFRTYTRIFLNSMSVFTENLLYVSKLMFKYAVPPDHKRRIATGWIFIRSTAPLGQVIKFGEVKHAAN